MRSEGKSVWDMAGFIGNTLWLIIIDIKVLRAEIK
jgi:hypothetical protein